MSHGQLFDKIRDAVSKASRQLLNKLVWRYGKRVIALERLRLESLINDWLYLESEAHTTSRSSASRSHMTLQLDWSTLPSRSSARPHFLTEDESVQGRGD